jgi:hypothetical protein
MGVPPPLDAAARSVESNRMTTRRTPNPTGLGKRRLVISRSTCERDQFVSQRGRVSRYSPLDQRSYRGPIEVELCPSDDTRIIGSDTSLARVRGERYGTARVAPPSGFVGAKAGTAPNLCIPCGATRVHPRSGRRKVEAALMPSIDVRDVEPRPRQVPAVNASTPAFDQTTASAGSNFADFHAPAALASNPAPCHRRTSDGVKPWCLHAAVGLNPRPNSAHSTINRHDWISTASGWRADRIRTSSLNASSARRSLMTVPRARGRSRRRRATS